MQVKAFHGHGHCTRASNGRRMLIIGRSASALTSSPPSAAQIIDGKKVSEQLRQEIAEEVKQLKASKGLTPGLAVVLVGTRKDSQAYVNSKKKACAEVGFESFGTDLEENASEDMVLKVTQSVIPP
jgi:hypothetical protein